jgi:AMIN domain
VKDFQPKFALWKSRFRRDLRTHLRAAISLGIIALATPWLASQTPAKPAASSPASKIAVIKSYRIVQEKDGPTVEILSTQPLVPAIQAITDPDRLVIDLPNARLEALRKRIDVQADQISTLRANQFQNFPPIVRVVVDLLAPRTYTWDAAGNRLVVHLGKNPSAPSSSPFQAPTVTSLTSAPQPVVASVRAAGPLSFAGNDSSAGSAITAGPDTAVLRLSSGGEVHVCPGTTVSITPSQNRHNLMLSMNAGAMEAHFALDASSDSVMTPDFRILLVGPGEFHYAFSADPQGNTCVRALPGNTASAIVSELLGDRTYQVKATDQLVFRSGQLDRVDVAVPLECGCPPPHDASMQATSNLPTQSRAQSEVPPTNVSPSSETDPPHAEAATATSTQAAAPSDVPAAANELHVQVAAPFVFHATGPAPAPVEDVRALPLDSRPRSTTALAVPLPPPPDPIANADKTEPVAERRAPSRGFFRKLGGFFAALFR